MTNTLHTTDCPYRDSGTWSNLSIRMDNFATKYSAISALEWVRGGMVGPKTWVVVPGQQVVVGCKECRKVTVFPTFGKEN